MASEEGKTEVQHTEVRGSEAVTITAPETPVADPTTEGMPEGGDVKFWDAAKKEYNWQAHATELQYKLEQKPVKEAATDKPEEAEKPKLPEGEELEKAAEEAGIDIETANQHALEHGTFDPATKAAAMKLGFPEEALDAYASFLQASVQLHVANVTEALGDIGMAENWMSENYSQAQFEYVQGLLQDPERWEQGIAQIRADMGKPPVPQGQYARGRNQAAPAQTGTGTFTDSDLQAAIQSPQWKDAKFREQIYAKARAAGMSHSSASARRHSGGM